MVDVDGTLYRQDMVRRHMALKLLFFAALHPRQGWKVLRGLSAYRSAQEKLRKCGVTGVASRQTDLAAEMTGLSATWIASAVHEWMDLMPLEAVRRARFPGALEFFQWASEQGLAVAALSDYDPQAKLEALSLAPYFSVVICAQDPDVNCFKPHTAGLFKALNRLGVGCEDAVYVGDRLDVDARLAVTAGIEGFLLTFRRDVPAGVTAVSGWPALQAALAARLQ